MKNFLKNKKGVSPIISTTLIFAILMTGVLIVYSWGLPLVIDFQDNSEVNEVTNQFYELDRNVKIVMHEGDGATRSTQFEFDKGLLNYTSSSDFSLILASGDPDSGATIDMDDLGRMTYILRSTMDDLAINSSSTLTGAVDAYPVLEVTSDARDAGVFPAFNEDDQNKDITSLVYTRPDFSRYSLFLEYRPIVKIEARESATDVDLLNITLYQTELKNDGYFPVAGSPEIIVKRTARTVDTISTPSLSEIQGEDQVYLYASVDGVYQQLTLDFPAASDFSLEIHTVTIEIQIYNV